MTFPPKSIIAGTPRAQLIAIAILLVFGALAAAAILRTEPPRPADAHGHAAHADDEAAGHDDAHADGDEHAHDEHAGHDEHPPGEADPHGHAEPATAHEAAPDARVAMPDAQIRAAGIAIGTASPAPIRATLQLPGEIRFNEDRTAHVVPRVDGVVESVQADLGQQVKKGQVLAVISSAGVSEQRSTLRAAQQRLALARTTYEREKQLWEEKISPQQDMLQARQAMREAGIDVDNARQKLRAIGAEPSASSLGRYRLRAPFDGMVVEKHIALGESVKADANVFTLSDLSSVWAEMSIGAKDLPHVPVGAPVTVRSTAFDAEAEGTVSFVGSLLGEQTRTAKARVTLPNPQLTWRPGLFVTVEVVSSEATAPVTVSADAVQTLDGQSVVFLKVPGGFVAQPVKVGRTDGRRVEIVSGLAPGAPHAAAGSFVVKSEHGKGSATHTH